MLRKAKALLNKRLSIALLFLLCLALPVPLMAATTTQPSDTGGNCTQSSSSGGASAQESQQTCNNHQSINNAIPVPDMSYSQRRWTLAQFYAQIINRPRLYTCTIFTSRGGMGGNTTNDILGVAPTIGIAVNLGFQMTDPSMSEPDSVYSPSSTDQTLVTFQNGRALVAEIDTSSFTGDCSPNVHPNTDYQKELDYILAKAEVKKPTDPNNENDVNFLCTGKDQQCDNT